VGAVKVTRRNGLENVNHGGLSESSYAGAGVEANYGSRRDVVFVMRLPTMQGDAVVFFQEEPATRNTFSSFLIGPREPSMF
jgi:hypothetical protein